MSGITSTFRFLFVSFSIIVATLSCKKNPDELVPVIDEVGHVGIYASEKNLNTLLELVQVKFPLLDSHLIIDDFSGDIRYENKWNFTPIEDEAFIKNHRLVITDESVSFPNKYDTSFVINDQQFNIYKNPFGLGQMIIEIEDFDETTISSMSMMFSLNTIIQYCNESIPFSSNEYSKNLQRTVENQFGIQLEIPSNFKVFKNDSNFIWISSLKPNGGYLSLCIENIPQEKLPRSLQEAISERNESSKIHFFNDEGTTMAVSDLGNYKSKLIPTLNQSNCTLVFRGWFTELGTTRRGPFERRYFVKNNRVVAVEWFSQGGTDFANDARLLRKIVQSAKIIR